jgi:hypothetical protein
LLAQIAAEAALLPRRAVPRFDPIAFQNFPLFEADHPQRLRLAKLF